MQNVGEKRGNEGGTRLNKFDFSMDGGSGGEGATQCPKIYNNFFI
tara:strand:+ start:852 stop:986 length:135 start_codon:yes stop_codon:yes gene_type:complete